MNNAVNVVVNGERIVAEKGVTLSEITRGEKPCGGHGKCGKCRVIAKGNLSELAPEERKFLSEEELRCGTRLACLTRV
ncbi:MAG: 2Fe-2S iron-sulfur cluster binding domain-containing protein, partial [Christensenellaceae bacterium]|nr:2Fe-2S iron-sulfur cluster binding domain-containing protein [Christensenellaceae bacterium]